MSTRVITAVALFALLSLPAYGQDNKGVEWEESFSKAKDKAAETGKLIMADFTSLVN